METGVLNESERIALLRSLNLLYTPGEQVFDDITEVAGALFDAPIAIISLIDDDIQWFKSRRGVTVESTCLSDSICNYAIQQSDLSQPLVVPDASIDPRFAHFDSVSVPRGVRMYVGMPLVLQEGLAIGTLCVADPVPRVPTAKQIRSIQALARNVVALIEFRRAAQTLLATADRSRSMLEMSADAVMTVDEGARVLAWNTKADELLGLSHTADRRLLEFGSTSRQKTPAAGTMMRWLAASHADGAPRQFELALKDRYGVTFMAELNLCPAGNEFTVFLRDITQRHQQQNLRHESQMRDIVIFVLARLAESRDPETGAHVERVQRYCQVLAEELCRQNAYPDLLDDDFVRLIYSTSPLHDIGKVAIPDNILLKPGKLTPDEFAVMQTHAMHGAATLDAALERFPDAGFLSMARSIAATHHEKFNGTGYPNGLAGQEIPLCGRIVALADVYDALTSQRVYKAAMPHAAARAIILKESGKHFDPNVVKAFLSIEDIFVSVAREYAEPSLMAA